MTEKYFEKEIEDSADVEFSDNSDESVKVEEIPKDQRALRTQAYDKSINDVIAMINTNDIILDPQYQRNYVWDNKKASLLIESILLNVPIPVIYVAEDDDSRWTVVDGLQRLYSLKRFFSNEFKLRGLEVLTELNNKQYSTLNPKASRILRNGILRMILIFKESHPEIKYDIFMRLNRGAIKLTEQELRNCLYRGKLNDLIMEIRNNRKYLELLGLASTHNRMVDAELILRYFTISECYDRKIGVLNNYAGKVKTALNRYCESKKLISDKEVEILRNKFVRTIDKIYAVLGVKGFQRMSEDGGTDGWLNRAIMDCVMVSFEDYELEELLKFSVLIRNTLSLLPKKDEEFDKSITFATSDKTRMEYRLNTWRNELKLVLGK